MARKMTGVRAFLMLCGVSVLGCYQAHGLEGDAGVFLTDANVVTPPTDPPEPPQPPQPPVIRTPQVDILFMVDNSGSMLEEQVALAQGFERLVRTLTSGDVDGDGRLDGFNDFEPVQDVNIGVVTSDMGTGGHAVNGCSNPDFGDDGVFQTAGNTREGCASTYPSVLRFDPVSGTRPSDFADDFRCVASLGTGGCGFEQQLDAMLKALSPSAPQSWTSADYRAPEFWRGTMGHGDGANAGFIRDGSVLALVPVSDEDDCSARDLEIFNTDSATYSAWNVNLRCANHSEALQPISRYVDGFLQLRAARGRLVYAPIVGLPADLASAGGRPDFQGILGDARMQNQANDTLDGLVPSCNTATGLAYPPRRFMHVAEQLSNAGAHVTVQSLCQPGLATPLHHVVEAIRRALYS